MIDIRAIREDPEAIVERLALRHDGSAAMIAEVLTCEGA